MEDYLNERKQQLDRVHKIMSEVHGIAKDMGVEVTTQGKKIEEINKEMEVAQVNVSAGKEQLEIKKASTLRGNKWLLLILGGVGIVLLVFIFILISITVGSYIWFRVRFEKIDIGENPAINDEDDDDDDDDE